MIQQDKELLLKDLCARLPYGVYVLVHDTFEYSIMPYENIYLKSTDVSSLIDAISLNERYNIKDKQFNRIIKEHKDFLEFKPYLRPMSSMTEEERKEYNDIVKNTIDFYNCPKSEEICFFVTPINWLNKHYFDYRGLIEKGLALKAPDGMYN